MVIIIEGAGEVGSHLAKMLSNEANDITVIDELIMICQPATLQEKAGGALDDETRDKLRARTIREKLRKD